MTANLAYWLFAYVLMTVTVVFGIRGILHIRAGRVEAHLKHMVFACNLLLFFVGTYAIKLILLGREIKLGWSVIDYAILYTHESFIGIMLITGTWARLLAARFRIRLADPTPGDLVLRRRHALLGKLALGTSFCALITATAVLYILYTHSVP